MPRDKIYMPRACGDTLMSSPADCHVSKNGHIDWTLGFKCDHPLWPWIFKVKYSIFYISWKMAHLPRNNKLIYQLTTGPQMWPSHLTLAMTLISSLSCVWPAICWKWVGRLPRKKTKFLDWMQGGMRCELGTTDIFWVDFRCQCVVDLFSHLWGLVAFTGGQFHRKCSRYFSLKWIWKLQI